MRWLAPRYRSLCVTAAGAVDNQEGMVVEMMHKVIKVELSAIFLTAALLLLSAGSLVGKAVMAAAPEKDPFPNLYVQAAAEFVQPQDKVVYFTFDDGPSETTRGVLNMLQRQGVKATFFVTGQNAEEPYAAELLQRMVDEGHTIGLHSYSHTFHEIYRSSHDYLADINKLNEYLYETVGVRPSILRFPGGSATQNASPEVMKEIIRQVTARGYLFYDWDVVSGDDTATVYEAEYLAERILQGAEGLDRVVVLLHDSPLPVTSAAAVEIAIERFREMGYTFDRLTGTVEPVHIKTSRLD